MTDVTQILSQIEQGDPHAAEQHGFESMSDLLDGWESEMSRTAIPFVSAPREKE
jgi:hypothetical protein